MANASPARSALRGAITLPLLDSRQARNQRAFLKIQDGCDAHCTYCIIPSLRPTLWSKPAADCLAEARALVAAGHVELVLTGIFLSAYGQTTALRRRQPIGVSPLANLIDDLCHGVADLRRLRLSSLEPGDLTDELIETMRRQPKIVPHFHLPLQSGSDRLLRRMNRQYTRDQYLHMIDRLGEAFDRPALTTDIIVGFPGETDEDFAATVEVARAAKFIHIHAFPYSPRPGTAAARWNDQFVPARIAKLRIAALEKLASDFSVNYRNSFIGQNVDVLVERESRADRDSREDSTKSTGVGYPHHGRCARYFDVQFQCAAARPGDLVRVRVERVEKGDTFGAAAQIVQSGAR